jgi:hypothetical protein
LSEVGSKLALTRDHILYFLLKFRDLDLNEPKSRQRLFDTFVNSIFVYDDKVVITFNYSGDDRQITLTDIDTIADESFASPVLSSTITRRDEHYIIVVQNVFAIIAKAEG